MDGGLLGRSIQDVINGDIDIPCSNAADQLGVVNVRDQLRLGSPLACAVCSARRMCRRCTAARCLATALPAGGGDVGIGSHAGAAALRRRARGRGG